MSDLTAADILDKAADHIETYGWFQDNWYDPITTPAECPVCAGGAINVAAGLLPDSTDIDGHPEPGSALAEAVDAFVGHLRDRRKGTRVNFPFGEIGEWNDAFGRTKEQVVAELRACAADLRREAK